MVNTVKTTIRLFQFLFTQCYDYWMTILVIFVMVGTICLFYALTLAIEEFLNHNRANHKDKDI